MTIATFAAPEDYGGMLSRPLSLLLLGLALAAPATAQAPESLSCTLGGAPVQALVDRDDGSVQLSNARNSKTQRLAATFDGGSIRFSDGQDPVALFYAIDRQSMRIDRWISDGGEGRTHLDDGKCRVGQVADLVGGKGVEPHKAP